MKRARKPEKLACVMPWKAFFMDHFDRDLRVIPCVSDWMSGSFGKLTPESTVEQLWNSQQAQEIRQLLATGQQAQVCSPDCHWLNSGRYGEGNVHMVQGTTAFMENQRINNQEIRERKLVLESRPTLLRLLPTLRCNNRCRMCYQDHNQHVQLPAAFERDVLHLFPYLYDYELQGGEVLIAEDFPKWVNPDLFAVNPQLKFSLITNSTVIPDPAREVLEQIRIRHITISLNAATRSTYQRVSQNDFFDQVLENTVYLRDLGLTHPVARFPIYLSFVIMRSTYHEIPEFVGLANRLQVPFYLVLVVGNRLNESIHTDPETLCHVLEQVNEAEHLTREDSIYEIHRVQMAMKRSLAEWS